MSLCAGQTNDGNFYMETKIVDGFSIGVTDYYGLTNTPTDRKLCFTVWTTNRFWATNRLISVIFPTQPEYAYQVEMFDTNGIAVPRTELGKQVGSKFLDYNPTSSKHINIERMLVDRKDHGSTLFVLFCPTDFFKITKPGSYTLRIRFQILAFPDTGPNRGDYTNVLVRFPPLNYPLTNR